MLQEKRDKLKQKSDSFQADKDGGVKSTKNTITDFIKTIDEETRK